ncbi:glycosyltransferase family 2 protein [Klebsiella sp. BIGb0407]|uniref:glycosyltransferase family 2 protein n=1 Tax=Klebsiella sp. BIGb0407 TaxID=2940603 RepID=UPI002167FA5D|nr:glycosyltransferase [Klebsiella sp. BIGb0407]MCS3430700.1 ceramide glucosyltransferase [Klebsiella sp. BIGb0407]
MLILVAWLGILLLKVVLTLRVIRRPTRCEVQASPGRVTILQPILSGDPTLGSTLKANVIALEQADFVWLIDDDDEVARVTVNQIKQQLAARNIIIMSCPAAPEGVNPKAFKLERAWPEVSNDIILVLDDDAILSPEAFTQLISEVGTDNLVTALPYYATSKKPYSALLAQFVNDSSALTYLPLLPYLPPLTINGMCYAIGRQTLAKVDGFARIQRHLTDDLALASLLSQHQIRLTQSIALVKIHTDLASGKKYWQQMHRWFLFATLLLREKSLKINLLIFLLQGLHPLLLWGVLLMAVSHPLVVLACLIIRQFALRKVQQALTPDIQSRPLLSLISELLQPLHLLHAVCNRTIVWRTRRYRVFSNNNFVSR